MKRTLILVGSCFLLFILWLPGLQYPILSDTAFYALLGESLWTHGRYELLDIPYAKHLPLHAFLSYPLIPLLGFSVGMKVATLLAGMATLLFTYLILRESFSERIALFAVPLVAVHHGFVLMTMLGSADLLFTALFLAALYAFLRAEDDQRWYLASGISIGLASLTRYNGVPIFGVFVLAVLLWRREDIRSWWFYGGALLGSVLFGLWLYRNFRVFGNPFHTLYTEELSTQAPHPLAQAWDNLFYYLDPSHNILPILMAFAVYGIVKEWKRQKILLLWILGVWVLTSFWWVQSIRFAFPAYPILIGFGIVGLRHVFHMFPKLGGISVGLITAAIITTHAGALCLYSYGTCNSLFDRTVGLLPKNLGLTSEGLYTWGVARKAANVILPSNAMYVATGIPRMEKEGFFRRDIRIVEGESAECPYYRITQWPQQGEKQLFATKDHPITYVTVQECR
ncbi:MAG: hypothetical protein Greene041662_248 [Candidatus Peregrinibacteria bacterium Greene0416_62]|nr:MAG: hypothetical protein Greene041662_248 [Candidatus Peregrinibacteria bacterium Greene0416_62]TSC98903.1 MAG: hypothetical protein Greene101449_785 [Candidatus Peregrinibacteria bacterium Greene1014_49]